MVKDKGPLLTISHTGNDLQYAVSINDLKTGVLTIYAYDKEISKGILKVDAQGRVLSMTSNPFYISWILPKIEWAESAINEIQNPD